MNMLKIGFIGVGGIAESRHIPAVRKLAEKAVITGVSDVNHHRAQQIAETYNIPGVYENYHDLLENVDAVFISTPNKFHAEISVAALQAGVHVFCEKPMALSTKECDEMIKAAEESGKVLSIGYHYRFMKNAQAAKKVMLEGEIGEPLVIRAQGLRRRKVPGWGVFTNKELQGGGSLIDYGCHLLDLALWLMGDSVPVEVMGSQYNLLSRTPKQVNLWGDFDHSTFEVDDHVTGYVRFENGASLLLETSWSANIKEDLENVSISGEKGGLDVFPFHLNQAKHGLLLNSEAAFIPGDDNPGNPQAENFVDCCLGLAEQVVKPEEARRVSMLIEAIYESSLTGSSVKLNERKEVESQ
ncbi:Predicted dehydrogenase [Fictibacillus solisalsi]|uniref:Predicted dehydrogenase n=1 Tax=Fictibacillus solisalsi TaxID=459525 RepID=A0A1G9U9P9_9BACL|nr:Gfo/Idh/MocA family oxidoreductase [Fictibacillus solisalsi]SDM56669.1 Predicted dehydrogenase [Fictibacillus solisalsi]